MNKYERNIKQIRDRRESAEMYFLDKAKEECLELQSACETQKYNFRRNIDHLDNFYEEIADVLNCIEYLTRLFDLDRTKIHEIREYKLDRGYERGEVEDD